MKLNQRGITLVELLGAMTLVALVAGIAWTMLMIGFKHTDVEMTKTQLQQDANLIITSLSNVHRQNEKYSLIFEGNNLKVERCNTIEGCTTEFIGEAYDYTGTSVNGVLINTADIEADTFAVIPTQSHTNLTLVLTDMHNPKRTITIKTTLTRILTGMK